MDEVETEKDISSIEPCNTDTVLTILKHRFHKNYIYVSKMEL